VDPASQTVGLRPVQIAQYRQDVALVSAGLIDGQRVVSAGVHKLTPGQAVRLFDDEARQ
jgi:multidrug efflux system membrane fusion protein